MALGFFGSRGKVRPDYLPIDEAHPLRPMDPYGLSKKIGEELLDVFRRRTGGEAISVRPGFILNPWMAMVTERDYGALPEGWYGSLQIYTDADDLAEGVRDLLALEKIDEPVVWMAAPDNALGVPTLDLCSGDWTRDVRIDREALQGTAALVRCDLARRMVGWNPKRLIGPQIEDVRRALKTSGRRNESSGRG
jgi:nucleoside-diphosphate-sugar epimerase